MSDLVYLSCAKGKRWKHRNTTVETTAPQKRKTAKAKQAALRDGRTTTTPCWKMKQILPANIIERNLAFGHTNRRRKSTKREFNTKEANYTIS